MRKTQQYKYEMLVRVREYGVAHRDVFPESSSAGERFAQVTATVAAIDKHLSDRALGVAEARKVKATTRAAVVSYMKTIANAARRVNRLEAAQVRFRMPRRHSLKAVLDSARLFVGLATERQEQFIELGLPSTFVSEFTALVNDLQQAVDIRLASKHVRGTAQAGIAFALKRGMDLVKDLDVAVAAAARLDPLLAAGWRSVRRIEGQNRPVSDQGASALTTPAANGETTPAVDGIAGAMPPVPIADSPPPMPLVLAPVQATVEVVARPS